MKRLSQRTSRSSLETIVVAIVAGLTVLLLLAPAHGVDTLPPQCYSMLGYPVPCERWVAPLAAAAMAGLVGWLLWRNDRRRQ